MSFSDFLNTTVVVQRMIQDSGNTDREYWQTSTASLSVHLQPLGPEQTALTEGAYFQSYKAFADVSADVKEGDRFKINSDYYTVSGVETHNYGNFPHLEIYLQKGNE